MKFEITSVYPPDSPEKNVKKPISLRLPVWMIEMIDEYAWKNRSDRTEFIETACRFFLDAVICPECGAPNARGSNRCSICGEDLERLRSFTEDLQSEVEDLVLALRSLSGLIPDLERAIFQMEEVARGSDESVRGFLERDILDGYEELRRVREVVLVSEKNPISKDLSRAEELLRRPSPDISEVVSLLKRLSGYNVELEFLERGVKGSIKEFQKTVEGRELSTSDPTDSGGAEHDA